MLDTYREVITPEGVLLHLPAAGPVPRALAWAVDLCLRLLLLWMLTFIAVPLGRIGMGFLLIVLFIFNWGYQIVMEGALGWTLGKRLLGLRVIMADGAPLSWTAAIARNLLRVVDMLPFGYALGLLSSLVDPHGRRLGDLAAGSLVVHTHASRALLPPVRNQDSQAPMLPLLLDEQMAVLAFAERGPHLSASRQQELADIARVLSQEPGPNGVQRLYAVANWLLGRK